MCGGGGGGNPLLWFGNVVSIFIYPVVCQILHMAHRPTKRCARMARRIFSAFHGVHNGIKFRRIVKHETLAVFGHKIPRFRRGYGIECIRQHFACMMVCNKFEFAIPTVDGWQQHGRRRCRGIQCIGYASARGKWRIDHCAIRDIDVSYETASSFNFILQNVINISWLYL